MTSENSVKILSKIAQSKSISKGKINKYQKPKKTQSRNVLESPFALEWPSINPEHEEAVLQSVKDSFSGMKKITFRPKWQLFRKLKGQEQKDFIQNYTKSELESALKNDPTLKTKLENLEKWWSELTFGYNQVMCGIEKNSIAAVLVERNTTPMHLSLTYLPTCANNGIPLVPISNLKLLAKDDDLLGVSHSCMVIGLKNNVKEPTSRFYDLYQKILVALNVEAAVSEDEESMEVSDTEDNNNMDNVSNKKKFVLLKRNSMDQRVFIPGKVDDTTCNDVLAEGKENIAQDDDFISFNTTESQESTKLNTTSKRKRLSVSSKKSKNTNSQKRSFTEIDFDSMFIVDDQGCSDNGDDSQINVPLTSQDNKTNEEKPSESTVNVSNKREKKKRKVQENLRYFYKPAEMKKIKNNPKRDSD